MLTLTTLFGSLLPNFLINTAICNSHHNNNNTTYKKTQQNHLFHDTPSLLYSDKPTVYNHRRMLHHDMLSTAYHHPRQIVDKIPPLDQAADILLLLGRDIICAHKGNTNDPYDAPYAQKLGLGWVIIGDVCIWGAQKTNKVSAMNTCILYSRKQTYLTLCENRIGVKENCSIKDGLRGLPCSYSHKVHHWYQTKTILEKLCTLENGNLLAHSIEDLTFFKSWNMSSHKIPQTAGWLPKGGSLSSLPEMSP